MHDSKEVVSAAERTAQCFFYIKVVRLLLPDHCLVPVLCRPVQRRPTVVFLEFQVPASHVLTSLKGVGLQICAHTALYSRRFYYYGDPTSADLLKS